MKHTKDETHVSCTERINIHGSKAKCCFCEPHEGCELDTPKETWEKRFLKEFVNTHDETWRPLRGLWVEEVLEFIRKELAQAKADVVDKIHDEFVQLAIQGGADPSEQKGLYLYSRTLKLLATLREDYQLKKEV